jgi:hypothetical protein
LGISADLGIAAGSLGLIISVVWLLAGLITCDGASLLKKKAHASHASESGEKEKEAEKEEVQA